MAVLAKAPVPGRVKTRLCPPLTPAQAAELARAALLDTIEACSASAAREVVVILDGSPRPWMPAGIRVIAQRQGDLGNRLLGAVVDLDGRCLVVGMDTPQLTADLIDDGLRALDGEGCDAVLGPALDGGYWAIGLRRADPRAFDGVPMSQPDTGRHHLRELAERHVLALLHPRRHGFLRQRDRHHGERRHDRAHREARDHHGVEREHHRLADGERSGGDHRVHGQQPTPVRVGGEVVEPALGHHVLTGEAEPGHEPQQRPGHPRTGEADPEHRRGQQRRERRVHADVAHPAERSEREPRPDHEAQVVRRADQAGDAGGEALGLGAHAEQGAEQPAREQQERQADEQAPRGQREVAPNRGTRVDVVRLVAAGGHPAHATTGPWSGAAIVREVTRRDGGGSPR